MATEKKRKKIGVFLAFLVSSVGAYSAIKYMVDYGKRQLQDTDCHNEDEAKALLLEATNKRIKEKESKIQNSKSFWKRLQSMISLWLLKSERIYIDPKEILSD